MIVLVFSYSGLWLRGDGHFVEAFLLPLFLAVWLFHSRLSPGNPDRHFKQAGFAKSCFFPPGEPYPTILWAMGDSLCSFHLSGLLKKLLIPALYRQDRP